MSDDLSKAPMAARDLVALFEWPQEAHHLAQLLAQHWPHIKAALLAHDDRAELIAALREIQALGDVNCDTALQIARIALEGKQ